jgi:hypothetical protein
LLGQLLTYLNGLPEIRQRLGKIAEVCVCLTSQNQKPSSIL